ncbi:hypothetical protein ACIBEF_32005, partial [Micromonospora sp. NPDC050795]|uniref:hypothetical protein n=1 Tax=Micromonospora sp. NPDC050795 TaxID=3364282 RepID=UPI00379D7D4D
MATMSEIDRLQQDIDGGQGRLNADLHRLGQYATQVLAGQSGTVDRRTLAVLTQLRDAVTKLQALDWYRNLSPQQWQALPNLPAHDRAFEQLRKDELADRGTVSRQVERLERSVAGPSRNDLGNMRSNLYRLTAKEDELGDVLDQVGRDLMAFAHDRIPFAANQIRDIRDSGGQSLELLHGHVRNREPKASAARHGDTGPVATIGLGAAMGARYGVGNCGEKADTIAAEAMRRYGGANIPVTVIAHDADHRVTVIGRMNARYCRILDPWPRDGKPERPESYGARSLHRQNRRFQHHSNGINYVAWANQLYITPVQDQLPPRPDPVAPFPSKRAAWDWAKQHYPSAPVFDITRTSRSTAQDRRGSPASMQDRPPSWPDPVAAFRSVRAAWAWLKQRYPIVRHKHVYDFTRTNRSTAQGRSARRASIDSGVSISSYTLRSPMDSPPPPMPPPPPLPPPPMPPPPPLPPPPMPPPPPLPPPPMPPPPP